MSVMSVMSENVAEKNRKFGHLVVCKKPLLVSLFIMDMQEITDIGYAILVNHCETSFLEMQ